MASSDLPMKILTYENNKNSQKALIAAQYVGVEIEQPPFEWGVTNKTEEFLKLTPIGKVPVLATPKGSIFESNAIARYVARMGGDKLLGSTDLDKGHVDQWIDFASNEVGAPLMKWATPVCGFGEYKEEAIAATRKEAERGLAALEKGLAEASTELRLVGDTITLADIVAVCELIVPWQCVLSEEFMKPYPTVTKYVAALLKEPEFEKVLGSLTQAPEIPSGPLPPEKNPFIKPKRSSSEVNGDSNDETNKKAKTDA